MNAKPDFWQIVCYALKIGFFTGLISGAGFGVFFGLLFSGGGLLFFAGILAIALLSGILIGIFFSAVNGLIIALVTQHFFLPLTDSSKYRRTIGGACLLSCLLLAGGRVKK